MTKKQRKEYNKKNRVPIASFNCGIRTHKSKKDYDRKKQKNKLRKMIEKEDLS